jgi:hypothetical protein
MTAALTRRLDTAVLALVPALFALALLSRFEIGTAAAVGVGLAVCAYLALSERYERNLIVLLLYLGLLDGFLRLRTGNSELTLVRDALLWSIAAGAGLRLLARREPIRLPPLAGWVLLFCALVLVQILNPNAGTLEHSLGGVRQHIAFVPLFFLGYATVRTKTGLRVFLVLVLVVGAVNGVVSAVQFSLTPDQLAAWGPGYEERITGEGDVSARVFVDEAGERRTRPFGLGSDMGSGGAFGLLALTAGLAAASLALRRRWAFAALPLLAGAILAILTSQQRTLLIVAVVAVVAFVVLGLSARRGLAAIGGLAVSAAIAAAVVGGVASNADTGLFDRYRTIAPSKVLATSTEYREDDIGLLGDYLTRYPLGAGLGSAGPASSLPGRPPGPALNAEGQLNFLVIEVGIAGLLAFLGLTLAVLRLALTGCRRIRDPETRLLLAALAAPLFASFAGWLSGIQSTNVPGAPYFWFVAGVLAFWLGGRARRPSPPAPAG